MGNRNTEPRNPGEIREFNDRVWDLTINLIHPTLIYLLMQLLVRDHWGDHPLLADTGWAHPLQLGLDLLLFLGAWCVFYCTLLLDMDYTAPWGTAILLTAVMCVTLQYLVFRSAEDAPDWAAWMILGGQAALAGIGWTLTMIRWRRLKAAYERAQSTGP